jgi:hypothetical protein
MQIDGGGLEFEVPAFGAHLSNFLNEQLSGLAAWENYIKRLRTDGLTELEVFFIDVSMILFAWTPYHQVTPPSSLISFP